jgi:hypothetical protein
MATQAKIAMRCVRTIAGTPIIKQAVPEKATQTFNRGALVYVDSAGYATECGADPTIILGVATSDGSNAGSSGLVTQVVELAHPDNLFRGYLDLSTTEATGASAVTDLMKGYGVAKSAAGGVWYVDKADTSAKRVVIWEFWGEPGHAVLDVRPHIIFGFIYLFFQGNIGT